MPNYLIRTKLSRQLIGLYSVPDFPALVSMVTKTNSVAECEYARVDGEMHIGEDTEFRSFPTSEAIANDP